jgi:tetratricopeptide (TPR) repeat protein
MILNTLYANQFHKPMYFAVTVSRDNMLDGLQQYLRMDGLTFKITTIPNWQIQPDTLFNNLMYKYRYTNLDNPAVYYDDNIIALLQNYRSAFIQLANHYATVNEREKVQVLMQKMESVLPPAVIPYTNTVLKYWIEAYQIYAGMKSKDSLNLRNYQEKELEDIAKILVNLGETESAEIAFQEILSNNPNNFQAKAFLVDIYGKLEKYQDAIRILEPWVTQNPGDVGAKKRLEEYQQKISGE